MKRIDPRITKFNKGFVARHLGKGVNPDGAYGNQCVDVWAQYLWEFFGDESYQRQRGNAWQLAAGGHFEHKYFDFITTNFRPGDWMIWRRSKKMPYGHIALNVGYGRMFNQDGFNPKGVCFITKYTDWQEHPIGAWRMSRPEAQRFFANISRTPPFDKEEKEEKSKPKPNDVSENVSRLGDSAQRGTKIGLVGLGLHQFIDKFITDLNGKIGDFETNLANNDVIVYLILIAALVIISKLAYNQVKRSAKPTKIAQAIFWLFKSRRREKRSNASKEI